MTTSIRLAAATIVTLAVLVGCQPGGPPVGEGRAVPTPPSASPIVAEPDYWPTAAWSSTTPEQQGVDSARLAAMFDAIDRQHLNFHSVLILRNGYVITDAYFSPYDAAVKQQIYSATKSVTGILTGIAISRGQLQNIGEPVLDFFPNRSIGNLDQNKRNITLEDLLTMRTGLDCSDDAGTLDRMFQSPDWVQFVLDLPMATAPGTQFRYCSPATHLLSAVLNQATGRSIRDLANEQLFLPLGIPSAGGPSDWWQDPQGITQGFEGLSLTPHDMAKLGLLYQQGGHWNGQQLVPTAWLSASVQPHTPAPGGRDYGYLFWVFSEERYYAALGLGGQDIYVVPSRNMVVVFTGGMDTRTHDQTVFKLLDDYVIPAASADQPLPDNPAALAQLQAHIEYAASPWIAPQPLPAVAESISGRRYRMDSNPNGWTTLSLAFDEGSPEARVTINGTEQLVVGLDNVYRTTKHDGTSDSLRGHWEQDGTFVIDDQQLGDFRQAQQFRVTFAGDQIRVEGMQPATGATQSVTGRLAP